MRLLALTLIAATAVSAQPSNWTLPVSGSYVALDAERPFFADANGFRPDFGAISSAWTLQIAQEVGPVRIVGELPFAFASVETSDITGTLDATESGAVLGNAQLGAEVSVPFQPLTFGGYVRVPTATDPDDAGQGAAQFVGLYSDYERLGAYFPDVVTLSVLAEARPSLPTAPVSFRLRVVPQVLIATEEFVLGDDAEVLVSYAAQAFVSAGVARIGGGLSGISIVTEDVDEDRHAISLGASADVGLGSLARLGVTGRIPISGETQDAINGIVGVRLVYGGL